MFIRGQLLEVYGRIVGNPLDQVLDIALPLLPYLGMHDSAAPVSEPVNAEMRLFRAIREDLDRASVRDVVIITDVWDSTSSSDVKVVLTLSREFLSPPSESYLLDGRFGVIGKVTRVVSRPEEAIDLTRAVALGPLVPDLVQQLQKGLQSGATAEALKTSVNLELSFPINLTEPKVQRPAIQLLPLAVFA